jgi:tetratricopeptide (TPR) repeat protein
MFSGNLGVAHEGQGRRDQALHCYQLELQAARETGSIRGEGLALSHLGGLYMEEGAYDSAQECYLADLERSRAAGDRANEGIVLGHLAGVARARGERQRARELYARAQELALAAHDGRFAGQWTMHAAVLELEDGKLAEATAQLAAAAALLEPTADLPLLARLHHSRALLWLARYEQAPGAAAAVSAELNTELAQAEAAAQQAGFGAETRLGRDIAELAAKVRPLLAGVTAAADNPPQ